MAWALFGCQSLMVTALSTNGHNLWHQSFLHAAVNNVGTNVRKPTAQYTDDEYNKVMTTNLDSMYKLTQVISCKAADATVLLGSTQYSAVKE